ncbi:ROP-interactive CRIB motif-containing protein 4 [Hibiscus trionum]|uniref:ROP-interactive CRIB motif-containing protein 4 n=1 Tax=Hibiscus trionum TaxID=183268 RepID=A0A9W7ITI1_HIBTR|nr:ROP-interactive CRIB motif-containing protein 4 [Hibiscus trionum]
MKERMERLVVLPFSAGCASQASVAVGKSPPRKPKPEPAGQNPTSKQVVGEDCSSKGRTKNTFGWLTLSRPNISSGIHRLVRITVKSFSQLFVYKEIEEVTAEMEIGYPTDVKHVTHIGLDGTTTTMTATTTTTSSNPFKGWQDFSPMDHSFIAFPSISLRQFELAMAAQTHTGPLIH